MSQEKDQKPEQCDSCQFETEKLYESRHFNNQGEEYYLWFCDLCGSTRAADATIYPTSSVGQFSDILSTICYVGNVILKKLNEKDL